MQNQFLYELSEIETTDIISDKIEQDFIEIFQQATNIPLFKLMNEDLSRTTTKFVPVLKQLYLNYLEDLDKLKEIKKKMREETFTLNNAFRNCDLSYHSARKHRDGKYNCIFKFAEYLKDTYYKEKNQIFEFEKIKNNDFDKNIASNSSIENNYMKKISDLFSENVKIKNENKYITQKYYELLNIINESYDLEMLKISAKRLERG